MKIKVCGLKDSENIKAVSGLTPDYMGFIFYHASPRFVNDLPPESLYTIPASVSKTGVFVNETEENINALIDKYNFNTIQLHGNEDPDFCNSFRPKTSVIKAFGVSSDFDFAGLNEYANKVDFFLFDTKTAIHGGSGKIFDWSLLDQYKLGVPFFLSGGISPQNLEEIKEIDHPQFYGVDLNSKFEIAPGVKNTRQLEKAFDNIKHILYK
jgi:phosphoribosylanthranilate isomerase